MQTGFYLRSYSRFILLTLSKNKQRGYFGKVQIVPQKNVNEASQFLLLANFNAQEKNQLGFQTNQEKLKNKKTKLQKGSGESWAVSLTWNPRLVKLIRGKGKELCCRLMAVLASGLLVTWTKTSPVRPNLRRMCLPSLSVFLHSFYPRYCQT